MARLSNIWEYLRTSFWFVPAVMVAGAILLLTVCIFADHKVADGAAADVASFIYVSKPGDARAVLATLLSSMITMASLVFSITMVVLSLAANQFGPRLIRNFMASPHTQLVLGTFVMTIVYCLLLLAIVGSERSDTETAFVSITVAIALALISVGFLVFFLHTLARSIVSETVIARVGVELDSILDAGGSRTSETAPRPEDVLPEGFDRHAEFLGVERAGYVQAIEFDRVVAAAARAGVLVGLRFRAGDYLVRGGRSIGIWPVGRCTDDLIGEIRSAIILGTYRTPVQDPEFGIRHLVEIADRALSPGVNDPYSAAAVIDQLSASLAYMMGRALPTGIHRDEGGEVRVVCSAPTYASLVGAAFDQIRQNGADKPVIAIRLIDAIGRIAPLADLPEQREALSAELDKVLAAAERRIAHVADLADIASHAQMTRQALGMPVRDVRGGA